jgi:Mrp family chromosome partitioning ATPase
MSRNLQLLQRLAQETTRTSHGDFDGVISSSVPPATAPILNELPNTKGGSGAQVEITKLVTRMFIWPNGTAPRVAEFFAIHSSSGGRIAVSAGEALAKMTNESVCIVDANLKNPDVHSYFGIPNHGGVREFLANSGLEARDCAVLVNGTNLWVMPAGNCNGGSAQFHAAPTLNDRVRSLRASFGYVLIQATPGAAAQAATLGRGCDGTIIVVEAENTTREAARSAMDELAAANVHVFGVVLNNRTFPIPEPIYRMFR